MNNLLIDLGLVRGSDDDQLAAQLDRATDTARAVLSAPLRRTHYERVHLQYEAIAVAASLLDLAGTRNDHQWHERCAEFGSAALPGNGFVGETE